MLVPGIAGMSVMATTFTALAYEITFLREEGILKRVRGTPMPTASFVGGMVGSAVVNAFVQVALVVVIGNVAYGVDWPAHPLSLVGFTALGVVCFGALGVAFSHAIPNVDSGPAYVNAVFLPLIFISGVFYSADSLPPVLEGDRRGAAAQAPDRLPLVRDRRRRRRGHRAGGRGRLDGRRPGARGALLPLGLGQPKRVPVAAQPRLVLAPLRGSERRAATRSGAEWSGTSRWATSCSTT